MSLIGALSTSSLAMLAQSHGMQTVSTNIANVHTTGYKREDTLFSTLLNNQKANGTRMFAVKPEDRRSVIDQGIITSTGRADDLALNGRGFFIASNAFAGTAPDDVYFTRDGSFRQSYVNMGDGTQQSYYQTGSGHYVMGWAADESGAFSTADSLNGLVPVRAFALDEIDGTATTEALMAANIPANTVIGDSVSLQGTVYDTSFKAQNLNYTWTKTAANNWTLDFAVGGGTVNAPAAGATPIMFNGNGQLQSPQTPVTVDITWDDGTTSSVAVDLTEMQQYADAKTIYRTSQDGNENGRLYDENFDENGVLWGNYTNGRSRPLYKLAIADFVAPDNLEAISGNLFRSTTEAGDLSVRDLESQSEDTVIQVGNLENSNVDIADEFTRMMMVQKAYTMASTNFRTVDEMIDVAVSIKR